MSIVFRALGVTALAIGLVAATGGCKKEFPLITEDECPQIVEHSKALLGEGVKGKTDEELLGVCRRSTPRQRGCAKEATVAADIMKCSLVRD